MPLRESRPAKTRILVIDDDPQRCAALHRMLCAEGFQCIAPVAHAPGPAYPIDLVIAGIAAQSSHRAIAARIVRLGGVAPVLAVVDHTAWTGFTFFDVANALRAAAVLQRPFPRAALLRSIDAVLALPETMRMEENSWDLLRSESSEFFHENPRSA